MKDWNCLHFLRFLRLAETLYTHFTFLLIKSQLKCLAHRYKDFLRGKNSHEVSGVYEDSFVCI